MTADAVEQPTVPEEAIEAAAREFYDIFWRQAMESERGEMRLVARAALAAAVPVIEKQLRARLADEIAGHVPHLHGVCTSAYSCPDCQWIVWAARIVRDEQP